MRFGSRNGIEMKFDFLVIGAGISGAAAACELAASGSVALIEAESTPGYHSTGRSAALFTRNYGAPAVRQINQASQGFFTDPPPGFCQGPLLTPRGGLTVAAPGEEHRLQAILNLASSGHEIEPVSKADALKLSPLLRQEHVGAAVYEEGVKDIDVAALHQGYLKAFKHRDGLLFCCQRVTSMQHDGQMWRIKSADQSFNARVVVNAAGAWAGRVAAMAGASSIGLCAKRRTAIVVDAPVGMSINGMPAVDFAGSDAYFKPDAGRILASPGDQTAMEPQDVQPDEWDIAVLVDWLETQTSLKVKRIAHSWAGLRSFVADEVPVVGFDPLVPNFFWLAAQGGYGIMMAPALGRATAGLIFQDKLPADLLATGMQASLLSPGRASLL
ncbi:MAG: NAD(P)/FAD-dependent oxidoreductase [Beijerinckiaceae bacterium]